MLSTSNLAPSKINIFHNYAGGNINVFGSGNSIVFNQPKHTELNELPKPGEKLCKHHQNEAMEAFMRKKRTR